MGTQDVRLRSSLGLLSALIFVLALAACGGSDGGGGTTDEGGQDAADSTDGTVETDPGGKDEGTGEPDPGGEDTADAAQPDASDAVDAADTPGDEGGSDEGGSETADTDAEEDGDDAADGGDAASDADADEPADPLTTLALAHCAQVCGNIEESCEDMSALGGDAAACEAKCSVDVSADPWWLGSYDCFSNSCSAGTCFPAGSPLPAKADCETGCGVIDTCGLSAMIDLTADTMPLCPILCAGGTTGSPEIADFVGCVAALPTDDCAYTEDEIGDCTNAVVAGQCEDFCGDLFDCSAPEDELYCGPNSDLAGVWADAAACEADCKTLTAEQLIPWSMCIRFSQCAAPATCSPVPTTPATGCSEACAAFLTACPDSTGGLGPEDVCAGACTGLLQVLGLTQTPEDAAACVEAWESCGTDDEAGAAFLGCILEAPAECSTMCDAMNTCGFGGDGFTVESCIEGCKGTRLQDPDGFASATGCIATAEGDCPTVATCLGAFSVPSVCNTYCGEAGACVGDVRGCISICREAVNADVTALATYACLVALPDGEDATPCDTVAGEAVPEECVTACTGIGHTCNTIAEGGCEQVCKGALAGTSWDAASYAQCIVEKTTPSCQVATVSECAL